MSLRYTLCFCRCADHLLMLLRRKPPHAGQWNGVGGKIEAGESPRAGIVREVAEETGIDLGRADRLQFGGIVTWPPEDPVNGQGSGMYVYVADFCDQSITWPGDRLVVDGTLRWQPWEWVCDSANPAIIENIPVFLPPMLRGEVRREYYCQFQGERLLAVHVRPLLQASDEDHAGDDE